MCTNISELISKGICPLTQIDLDLDPEILKQGVIVIDEINGETRVYPKWRISLPAIWIIKEDYSLTDNNDNDNLTYFKYSC